MNNDLLFFTVSEAASELGVSTTQVRRLIKKCDLVIYDKIDLPKNAVAVTKCSVLNIKKKMREMGKEKCFGLLTIPQSAIKLGCSPDWIRTLIKSERLHYTVIGRTFFIHESCLNDLLLM